MARAFRRTQRGFEAHMDALERTIVSQLLEQTRDLLLSEAPGRGEPQTDHDPFALWESGFNAEPPQDPALARLLPSGNVEDDEAAEQFRRYTQESLRSRKVESLDVAVRVFSGPETVTVIEADAPAVCMAMNDVRLVLGERLGLTNDEDADAIEQRVARGEADEHTAALVSYYDFLTWLQESLSLAMMGRGLSEA